VAANYPFPSSYLGTPGSCNFIGQGVLGINVYHISVDKDLGHLFVADYDFGRVLLFKSATTAANLSIADVVFGQPDFTTVDRQCTANRMANPYGVQYYSPADVLIVGDGNRVVFFDNALSASNGPSFQRVLGQPNPTTCNNPSGTQNSFSNVEGVFYSPDSPGLFLFACDVGVSNRIMRFECSNPTPTSSPVPVPSTSPSKSKAAASVSGSVSKSPAAASSSGAVAASSVVAASSGAVAASSVVAASSGVVAASGTPSVSQSNTPSESKPAVSVASVSVSKSPAAASPSRSVSRGVKTPTLTGAAAAYCRQLCQKAFVTCKRTTRRLRTCRKNKKLCVAQCGSVRA